MFEHSVKVPRHYKIAANILKKVSTEGGSVKTLLYDDKLRHFRTNVLYALITETIKHAVDIDKLFENCKILETETRLDPWLAKVLTAELLFGKKSLPGKSKPEQTILSYRDQFEKYTTAHQDELKTEATPRPRYVRINTNLLTTSDAIRAFQDEGYRFIRCTSGSYDDYLKQIQNLTVDDFTQDYHVKTVFVFSPGTKLHEHELYLENKIILQDKATALAVHLLAPPPGSVVLDMCAAPGMKTTQLAAYMKNEGKIYAVERNEKRYHTLCEFVEKTGSKCVETMHKDSLEIKRGELEDVEYILLDPSCSGSGMEFCVHNYIEPTRLAKLTSLQEKFLKHAMNAFPKAKRIVYSTCSLYPEENERVVTNVVKTSRAKWRVQDVKELLKGKWNNFGSAMYGSMGTRCMYAKPDSDLTTGFFLAVIDRDEKDFEKSHKHATEYNIDDKIINNNEKENDNFSFNKKKKCKKDVVKEVQQNSGPEDTIEKKKKKKERVETVDSSHNFTEITEDVELNHETKKKKKRKRTTENEINDKNVSDFDSRETKIKKAKHKEILESIIDNTVQNTEMELPKKKKAKKCKIQDEESLANILTINKQDTNDIGIEDIASYSHNISSDNIVNSSKHKHKKKKKDSCTLDSEKYINDLKVAEDEEMSSLPNEKKKKKNRDKEILESNIDIYVQNITSKTTKKKKRKHSQTE